MNANTCTRKASIKVAGVIKSLGWRVGRPSYSSAPIPHFSWGKESGDLGTFCWNAVVVLSDWKGLAAYGLCSADDLTIRCKGCRANQSCQYIYCLEYTVEPVPTVTSIARSAPCCGHFVKVHNYDTYIYVQSYCYIAVTCVMWHAAMPPCPVAINCTQQCTDIMASLWPDNVHPF